MEHVLPMWKSYDVVLVDDVDGLIHF